jgi:hypothetical protein
MKPDEKRVISHPTNIHFAKYANKLGMDVQIDPHCPPGQIFLIDPARLFGGPDGTDEGWENSVGRVDCG